MGYEKVEYPNPELSPSPITEWRPQCASCGCFPGDKYPAGNLPEAWIWFKEGENSWVPRCHVCVEYKGER